MQGDLRKLDHFLFTSTTFELPSYSNHHIDTITVVQSSKAIQCHSHRNPIHTHDECGVTAEEVRIRNAPITPSPTLS